MKVSIIVPNYNGMNILRKCLVSLLQHDRKPDQIVVVDNGSSDNSVGTIKRDFPQVTLVALKANTGFTGANNAGLKVATGDMLVLLNNDCIVEPNWLNALLQRMENPSVAAASSSMRDINDTSIIDSAGGEIDWMGFSADAGRGEPASCFTEPKELPFPCGGAVMIRREALPDPYSIFWNDLFIYSEDMDLGFQLIRRGWKIVYEPQAIVRHIHSATMSKVSFFKEYLCTRNRLLVLRKHFDPVTFEALTPVFKEWMRLWTLISLARGRFTLAGAIVKGTAEGLRMPVDGFSASIPLNDIFIRFALSKRFSGRLKNRMYSKSENIIRNKPGEEEIND